MEIKMKIIIGLGNPDAQYKNTFHNLGFMCADQVAEKLGLTFNKSKCRAQIAEGNIDGQKVIIAKPQTYMDLSGESVRELVSFYKIPLSDIIVMYDDYDINVGVVRIRESGSAGTHNGMRNIVQELGQSNFARVRVGFKPLEPMQIPLINYVLSGISSTDKVILDKAIAVASDAGVEFARGVEIQKIMQKYNGKAQ
jgi:PTH1 family peptidyl-tRNA hydrolase